MSILIVMPASQNSTVRAGPLVLPHPDNFKIVGATLRYTIYRFLALVVQRKFPFYKPSRRKIIKMELGFR